MISSKFVHENMYLEECANRYEQDMLEINKITSDMAIEISKRNDMMSLGIFTESAEEYFQESVSGAVTALGQKIIDIVDTIIKKIKEIISGIGKDKNAKLIDEQLAKIKKEDPELAAKLQIKLSQSDININSVKDLTEYYENVEKLADQLKKESVDPKSIKGRFEKLKTTLDKNKGTIAAVASICGIAFSAAKFIQATKASKASKNCYDAAVDSAARSEVCVRKLGQKGIEIENIRNDTSITTRLSVLAEMVSWTARVTDENVNGMTKLGATIASRVLTPIANASERLADRRANRNGTTFDERKNALNNSRFMTNMQLRNQRQLREAREREDYATTNVPNRTATNFPVTNRRNTD